jgi:phosphoribosylformylglycinamidine cyclo-ligase
MITYKQSGVDIDAGNEVVRRIKKFAKGVGFFGGCFPLGKNFLVGATDGVGTKLKIAFLMNRHDTIGIDLVAMNVNDVVVCGAKPLFFLDYIGAHKVHPPTIEKIVKGIAAGCKLAGCELIGGETAELSDMYKDGEYDLAGFTVGLVEKKKVINGSKIKEGDKIIGLASSGLHSNGYSLARKILLEQEKLRVDGHIDELGRKLGDELLTPTRIYVPVILEMIKRYQVKGLAHITGGGILENLGRVIPKKYQAVIEINSWPIPPIFKFIQKLGKVEHNEMYRAFNMGLGMIAVVEGKQADRIMQFLKGKKEKAFLIGEIGKGKGEVIII